MDAIRVQIAEEPMADDVLLQMINQNDAKHDEAHRRLRSSLRELEEKLESNFQYLRDGHLAAKGRLDTLEQATKQPVDVTRLILTPRVVFGIVAIALALAGAFWASTFGLRADVQNILTRMESAARLEEEKAKLADERSEAMKEAIATLQKEQRLLDLNIRSVNEGLLLLKGNPK